MSHVLSTIDGAVMAITLNREDKKNALTLAMYSRLSECLLAAEQDDAIKVITLTGSETCFSAGNDLADFVNAGVLDDDHPVVRFLQIISTVKKPIIAGVAGHAVGIGTTMLMHCDLVYAAQNATFQLPFVPLGLCPEAASSLILPNLMGYHRAAELLLFGEPFDADHALQCGMINKVLNTGEVTAHVGARARQLSKLPHESVLETKRLLKENHDHVMAVMDEEIISFGRLLHSETCQAIIGGLLKRS